MKLKVKAPVSTVTFAALKQGEIIVEIRISVVRLFMTAWVDNGRLSVQTMRFPGAITGNFP